MSSALKKDTGLDVRRFGGRHQLPSLTDGFISGLMLIALALGGAWVFLAALGLVGLEGTTPLGAGLQRIIRGPDLPHGLGQVAAAMVGATVGLVAMMALFRRAAGANEPAQMSQPHILAVDERGLVFVDRKGVATVAATVALRVSGVVDAEVDVEGAGSSPVRLHVRCWAHAGAPLSDIGAQVRDKVSKAVPELVGLDVQEVLVELIVVPLEELSRVLK